MDFKDHELTITKSDCCSVYHLKKPKTIIDSIKFINTNGIMAVTGDYGNWLFCREFHPSKEGVSSGYWCEKLRNSSTQDPYRFSSDVAKEEIEELLKEEELSDEVKEWLGELSEAADEGEYMYIAKCMDRPGDFEAENIPRGKELDYWLEVIFDAFDEICKRTVTDSEIINKLSVEGTNGK